MAGQTWKEGVICLCKTCSDVRQTWGFGHIMVGGLSAKSAMYIAGYVAKKMTNSSDPRLNGRAPEFARMSLRPGLGALALAPVVSVLEKYQLPVPCGLRHGEKIMPMGRYIRRKIAEAISDGTPEGISNALDSKRALRENMAAVQTLRAYSWNSSQRPLDVLKQISSSYTPPLKKDRPL